MKIFISWSGDRSKALAQGLHDWLPLVLHYAEPWLSEADIEAGERWGQAVAKELEACNYGIIALTRENLNSAWVLFEAGALAKSMQTSRVTPLLLDLEFRDLTGPLTQFQAKKVDQGGLNDIIESINKNSSQAVPEVRAKQLFEALWPEFEKKVSAIPKPAAPAKHARPQPEVLEELVSSVRSLESRFREVSEEPLRQGRFRRMRLHPMMMHDMAQMAGAEPGDPLVVLMLASLFREDAPWLYELGAEAYRAFRYGPSAEARAALKRFKRALELLKRGPIPAEELGVDHRMIHVLSRELDHLLLPEAAPEEESENKVRGKKAPKSPS